MDRVYKLLLQKSKNQKFLGDLRVLSRYLRISIEQILISLKMLEKQNKLKLLLFSTVDFITILDIDQMDLNNYSLYAYNQLNSPSYA